jgi:hypothetical protein
MSRQILAVMLSAVLLAAAADGAARGPWRASEENTRGWQLMSPGERLEHQTRIRGFRTLEECRAYQQEHHRLMEQRAVARGVALPAGAQDVCEHLQPPVAVGR